MALTIWDDYVRGICREKGEDTPEEFVQHLLSTLNDCPETYSVEMALKDCLDHGFNTAVLYLWYEASPAAEEMLKVLRWIESETADGNP